MNVYDLPPRRPGVNTCHPCPPPPPMPPHCGPHHGPCHDPFHDPCCEPPHHCHPPYQIINHYNKVCFKNYDEAVSKLKVKNLLPGEMAFAYYFDKTADYGINAIAAVGSIKLGGTNIIYDNADKVQQLMDKLQDTVSANNEKFDSIKTKLDMLDNIIKNDSSNSSTITSSLNNIKKDIENLKDTDTSIFERLDTIDSQVNQVGEYLEAHEEFAQALDASVKKLRDDVDNLGLDGKLNELDQKIDQTKQDILTQATADHAKLKSDFEKQINDLSTNYSSSLDDLKVAITAEIEAATTPIKNDIYDLQVKDGVLNKKIDDTKVEAITESKQYTDQKIEDTMQDINTSLTKMKNDIHDLSDLITESTTNSTNAHQELKNYIDGIKADITGENTTFKGEVTAELNSQKQFLKDSIEGFKSEYTASTNDSIQRECGKVQTKLEEFINTANTKHSAIDAKISTIEQERETYKTELVHSMNTKIAELNTNMRNYLDSAITQDRIHYDEIYARKDEIPSAISGGKGIVIENGVANLTIDDNGILTIGGKRYQLNQI